LVKDSTAAMLLSSAYVLQKLFQEPVEPKITNKMHTLHFTSNFSTY